MFIISVFVLLFYLDMVSGSEELHIRDKVGISDESETYSDEIDDCDQVLNPFWPNQIYLD